jgi:hypothetical protein
MELDVYNMTLLIPSSTMSLPSGALVTAALVKANSPSRAGSFALTLVVMRWVLISRSMPCSTRERMVPDRVCMTDA